ncbi:MAG: NAD-dependent epimerase/dehydratase family protein [Leptolyngbya sp. SIOISBB]|nr:NAD-dependent epimerase/dehydratase family protein [Leptolyngbya sp. SIOISBB]
MNLLITGATGFIGLAFCQRLFNDPTLDFQTVYATIRDCTKSNSLPSEVKPLLVNSLQDWRELFSSLPQIDSVIHLAACVHQKTQHPDEMYKLINTDYTTALAQAAAKNHVKRFIYVSTVKVIGEGNCESETCLPYDESTPPRPTDAYGLSKWNAEQALIDTAVTSELEVVILRPPLVYGPGVKANFLRLAQLAQSGLPLPLGAIQNKRSLIYVENLIDAMLTCITHPQAANKTFLVSDGQDLSTPDLIKKIAVATGYPCRLFSVPPAVMELAGICGDALGKALGLPLPISSETLTKLTGSLTVDGSKICHDLGWHPPFTVEAALAKTFEKSFGNQTAK